MRFCTLGDNPDLQPEIIARHYASLAITALNLLQLIEAKRYSEQPAELDKCIKLCLNQIKSAHWQDLGLELAWPKRK